MSSLILGKTDPFSPWRIPRSILRAWWCADDHGTALMTDDGGGLISSWKDRINALEVTAATSARPTWGATAFNSAYKGLTFDGTANAMVMATLDASIPVNADPSMLAIVVTPGAVTNSVLFSYGGNGNGTRRQLNITGVLSGGNVQANDGSSAFQVTDSANNFSNSPSICISQFEAGLLTLYRAGTLIGTDSGTLATIGTRLRIGASAANSPGGFLNGPIRHVMVFAGVLSAMQRQQLEGWLAWNSGLTDSLPPSHPYKSVRP